MAANPHFYSLRVDGVFTVDTDGALVFEVDGRACPTSPSRGSGSG